MIDEQKDKVSNEHAEYIEAAPFRKVWRDVLGGTATLRKEAKTYLPQFPLEHADDYKVRCDTATMLNATAKTLEAFCGLVFQKDLTLGEDVPTEIAGTETKGGLAENIDNKGNHLNVFAREVFADSFDGCAVILVDSPATVAADFEIQGRLGIRPYFVKYEACDVINWDYEVNAAGRTELSLIVLRERKTVRSGKFLRDSKTQYRVFSKDKDAVTWELWEEQKDKHGKVTYKPVEGPNRIDKQTSIPVAIVGALGDKPPLSDLAYKNIEHAQTYSDYKSIIHKTCVPIPFTTGVGAEEFGKAQIGGTMYHLPENATLGFAEVTGGSIDKTEIALANIKKDMAMLGLAMLAGQPVQGDVTATETMLDSIQETSSLQVRANQLKDALELALGFMARYLGKGEDQGGSVELGANWNQLVISPSEIQTYNTCVTDGTLSLESFLWFLEKSGKLPPDITAEDEKERIETEMKEQATTRPVVDAQRLPNETEATETEPATVA